MTSLGRQARILCCRHYYGCNDKFKIKNTINIKKHLKMRHIDLKTFTFFIAYMLFVHYGSGQTVEVQGQLKVTTVDQNDTASQVLVRNVDGSVAKRNALTIGGVASFIKDNDNNTKVYTEKNANEDIIRFDLGGTEKMVLNKNLNEITRIDFRNNANNAFIGDSCAIFTNFNSLGNIAIGKKAMFNNTQGDYNVAIGQETLFSVFNDNANGTTAIGYQALRNNIYARESVAIGYQAGFNSCCGDSRTAIGYQAMYQGAGVNCTALGYKSMYNSISLADDNTAIGHNALYFNGENDGNTAIGSHALYKCVYGFNTAVGAYALMNTTQAANNVAIGFNSLFSNTTGQSNTAIGSYSLRENIIGGGNVAIGNEALQNNKSSTNTAIGSSCLKNNVIGSGNTAIGNSALAINTDGNNTAVGTFALSNHQNGVNNTAIGYSSGVSINGLSNATAVGANAIVAISNAVVLGNNANVGIGISAPTEKLHVVGNGLFSGTVTASCGVLICSDKRYKKNILPISHALSSILQLNGVNYQLKVEEYPQYRFTDQKQVGLIAQDVELIFPEVVFTNDNGYKAIDYSKLTPILIEAIKELKTDIDGMKKEIEILKTIKK